MTYKEIALLLAKDCVQELDYERSELICHGLYKIIGCNYHYKGNGMSKKQIEKCANCYVNFLRAGQELKDVEKWEAI